ncbi:hypothetical protein C8R44DRAFT_670266 [Mycena epipterygia]|nr:hypothetical protein C8R44DRAFT_670266 [Mycena epipterygia]
MATTAPKTLSTSTLSLKFMQNAHRARNLTTVELAQAAVKDDGEWEVAQVVRDAWGPASAAAVHEASYLPFLFGADKDDAGTSAAATLKGRRAFKRGREVAGDEYQAAPVPPVPAASSSNSNSKPAHGGKPKTISGASSTLSGRPSPKGKAKARNNNNANMSPGAPRGRTAREAVRDNSGVGADLRSVKIEDDADAGNSNSNKINSNPTPSAPAVFLKPAGVDDPRATAPAPKVTRRSSAPSSDFPSKDADASGGDSSEGKPKGKRARDPALDGDKKRKKKLKKSE